MCTIIMPVPSLSLKLRHLPLRPSTLAAFEKRGFVTTLEIVASKRSGGITNLAAELGCTLSEAASLVREVELATASVRPNGSSHYLDSSSSTKPASSPTDLPTTAPLVPPLPKTTSVTAASLLTQSRKSSFQRNIVTFCRSIDTLLGGGMNLSEVTEIVGLPGVGKTQLAMQLCIDARLPKEHGGVQGEAVYIDSEGSFSPERCFAMAQFLVEHVRANTERRNRAAVASSTSTSNAQATTRHTPPPLWFTPETILDGIHVYRVHDEAAQMATIQSLPTMIQKRAELGNPVRLVVIDSIAFHYRCAPPGSDYMARTRSLTTTAAFLSDVATKFDVAVVAINQMTTKMGANHNNNNGGTNSTSGHGNSMESTDRDSRLVPALGEAWAHATTTRLLLSYGGEQHASTRRCTLVKSPHKAAGTALYQVTEAGIRDVHPSMLSNTQHSAEEISKRQRRQ